MIDFFFLSALYISLKNHIAAAVTDNQHYLFLNLCHILVSQISSIAKFLPQRSSSRLVMAGTKTASAHYVFWTQNYVKFSIYLLPVCTCTSCKGPSTITICNQHWKQLFRAGDPNIIFTQNRGQDLFELIYHWIKGNLKFWEQIFSRLKVCQNNFGQVFHRSKEKGEKQPILVNGIREVGGGQKHQKHRKIIPPRMIPFFSNKQKQLEPKELIQQFSEGYSFSMRW